VGEETEEEPLLTPCVQTRGLVLCIVQMLTKRVKALDLKDLITRDIYILTPSIDSPPRYADNFFA
jgi:hypothetical protein